jgi:collagen triple helix repeat protein
MTRKLVLPALVVVMGVLLVTNPLVAEAARQITGADIKNSSITTVDVKDRSLLAADFKAGQLPAGKTGATGQTGPSGPTGPTGVAGAKGADGEQGVAGPKGDTGSQGETGLSGAQGPKGETGASGALVTKTVSMYSDVNTIDEFSENRVDAYVGGWRVIAHCRHPQVGSPGSDAEHLDYVEAQFVGAAPAAPAKPMVVSPARDAREVNQDVPTTFLASGTDTRTLQAMWSDGSNPLTVVVSRVRTADKCWLTMTASAGS